MRTPPRNTGFQHPYSSEITPKAVYEDRRQMLKRMAGGAAGAAIAAWAGRQAMAQQVTRPGKLAAPGQHQVGRGRCGDDGEAHRLQGREHLQQLL